MRMLQPVTEERPYPAPDKGLHAQAIGVAALTRLGYQLATPLDPRLPFDYLGCRADGRLTDWVKFQVKAASAAGVVSLRRGGKRRGCKRYVAGDFDWLLVVDEGDVFLIPYAAIQFVRSRICVRDARLARYRLIPGREPVVEVSPARASTRRARPVESSMLSLFDVSTAA